MPVEGSVAFGCAWAGVGLAFAAIAGTVAQLTRGPHAATGISIAVLGAVYMLRAFGDLAEVDGPRWLSWLSPVGWGHQFRPYAGDRWWVLLIIGTFTVAGMAGAYALSARRDLGAGLIPDRPGRAAAATSLASPLGLAWRLNRSSLLAWGLAFALLGMVFGSLATNVSGFFESPQARGCS